MKFEARGLGFRRCRVGFWRGGAAFFGWNYAVRCFLLSASVSGAIHCDFICDCYDGCMCGRYSIAVEPSLIEERFGVRFDARFSGEMKPRYNAAPSQSLPVILNSDPG